MLKTLTSFIQKYFILIFCAVYFVALLYRIDYFNLWRDESFSVNVAAKPLARIVEITSQDVHPPLHLFMLHYWMKVFGQNETSVRVLSLIFSVVSVFYTYKLAQLFFKEKKFWYIATLFVATSPFLMYHAIEARAYSMVVAGTVILLYYGFTLFTLEEKEPLAHTFKDAVIFGIAATIGLYGHAISVIILAGVSVWLGLYLIKSLNFSPQKMWQKKAHISIIAATYFFIGLAYLPWLIQMIAQTTRVSQGFWIQFHPVADFLGSLDLFYTSDRYATYLHWYTPLVLFFITTFGFMMTFIGFTSEKKDKVTYLPSLVVILLGTIFLISYKTPLYFLRYLIFIVPVLGMLFTFGTQAWFKVANKYVVWTIVSLYFVANLYLYFGNIMQDENLKTHFKDAVSWIGPVSSEAVILHPHGYTLHSFLYYSETPGYLYDPKHKLPHYEGIAAFDESNYFKGEITQFKTIWVPYHWKNQDFENLLKDNHYILADSQNFAGGLTVEKWTISP